MFLRSRHLKILTNLFWLFFFVASFCGCDGMITSVSQNGGETGPKIQGHTRDTGSGAVPDVSAEAEDNPAASFAMLKANEEGVTQLTGEARLVADRVIELDEAERLRLPASLSRIDPPKVPSGRFHGMQVTDGQLEKIQLTFTPLTDDDLMLFSKVTSLKELLLSGSFKITDAGVAHLAALKNLHKLRVDYSFVSNEAIESLRKVLPNCLFLHAPIPPTESE